MMNVSLRIIPIAMLFIAFFLLITALLQWLWNITMPEVFNLKSLNYWQAFRLLLIASILFGSSNINL